MQFVITGAAGTVGTGVVRHLLKHGYRVLALDRNEVGLLRLHDSFQGNANLTLRYSDVRSIDAHDLEGVEVVIHAAAIKSVFASALNPAEVAIENIQAASSVIAAACRAGVAKCLLCSTDKAASPISAMASSKRVIECLTQDVSRASRTALSAARLVNIIGSHGSVLERFADTATRERKVYVHDPLMTRYVMSIDQTIDFLFSAMDTMQGGEIFIPDARSFVLQDLAEAFTVAAEELWGISGIEIVHRRPDQQELQTERLIAEHELSYFHHRAAMCFLHPQRAVALSSEGQTILDRVSSTRRGTLAKSALQKLVLGALSSNARPHPGSREALAASF